MSPIPAFQLGLWNAWIPVIPMLVNSVLDARITHARQLGDFPLTRKETIIVTAVPLITFGSFLYAVFLPLQLGTIWLYGGLLIYLLGLIFSSAAVVNFATTADNRPVTKGVYRVSRHPMYLGLVLAQVGVGIACGSWLYLLLALVLTILLNAVLPFEERYCLQMYGDAYREYMNRTPKWVGMARNDTT